MRIIELESFISRLKKVGIHVKLSMNFPWIYIKEINGKLVTEKYYGNHGFTIGFYLSRKVEFTDTKEIFKLIRNYVKNQ